MAGFALPDWMSKVDEEVCVDPRGDDEVEIKEQEKVNGDKGKADDGKDATGGGAIAPVSDALEEMNPFVDDEDDNDDDSPKPVPPPLPQVENPWADRLSLQVDDTDISGKVSALAKPVKPKKPVKPLKPEANASAGGNSSKSSNPFSDDSDGELSAGAYLIPPPSNRAVGANAVAVPGNPFGDSDDDDEPQMAHVLGAATAAVTKLKQQPSISVVAQFAHKTALKEMMLMGYRQAFSQVQLTESGGSVLAASKVCTDILKTRKDGLDNQIWHPVLGAKVSAWMPAGIPGNQYTVYIINVSMDIPGYSAWKLSMRYSSFKQLSDTLYRLGGSPHIKVPFPSTGWMTSPSDKKHSERKAGLDSWIRSLLLTGIVMGTPACSAAIFNFLDVMKNLKAPTPSVGANLGASKVLRKPSIR